MFAAEGPAFAFGVERDESIDLNDSKSRTKPENRGGDAPDMRVVGIDFNPGPDAHDRLRRLFTLLLNHVASEGEADPGEDVPADAPSRDGTELETSARDAHGGDAL